MPRHRTIHSTTSYGTPASLEEIFAVLNDADQRLRRAAAAIEARYPVAEGAVTTEQQARQDDAKSAP